MSSYMFSKSSRMCLIKISQPSIFSFAMPFSFSLSSFHCMALKKMTRFISLSSRRALQSLKWQGFYYRISGLSHWFQEALLLLCPLSVLWRQPEQGHRCCLDAAWRAEGHIGQRAEAAGNEERWVKGETRLQLSPLGHRAIATYRV